MADAGFDEKALCEGFNKCCSFGVTGGADKKTATSKNVDKWFKDAGVMGKKLTSTDTDICFSKVKEKGKKEITYAQFLKLCEEMGKKYGDENKLKAALSSKHLAAKGTTKTSKTGGVEKMTDTSQYTGAHKERFDESGKGKGIEGRVDRDAKAEAGYVGGYKGEGSYEKKE